MAKPRGFILERKLSPIDGKPIVVILTTSSGNRKTGNMCQVWILRDDINPVEALNHGDDVSICGDCPHRKQSYVDAKGRERYKRSCYVNVGQAPNSVWKAYKRGAYLNAFSHTDALESVIKTKKIRWGAYGDPALITPQVVDYVNSRSKGHTGYTHQWRSDFAEPFKGTFQASVDSMADLIDATDNGWKTFIVVSERYAKSVPGAKQCPATVEKSQAVCNTCTLCDGGRRHIYVRAHGPGSGHHVFS